MDARNYIANNSNNIFSTNTPVIGDANPATTSTFTIRATTSVLAQTADRTFTITINPPVEVQFRNEGASANTSNWNNGSTFTMAQFGGLGNVTAHGGTSGPVTFTLSLTGLPTHTDIRYQVFWHMVDSLDNETSS
jgi:hypothetical protein